jgi:hypothetical protein
MIKFNSYLNNGGRWLELLRSNSKVKRLFREAYATVEADLVNTWIARSLYYGKYLTFPVGLRREVAAVAGYLNVPVSVVAAAQVLYDTAWALGVRTTPIFGCTSASFCLEGQVNFGRNLDWGYPENAEEFIFHMVVDDRLKVECFAGLLGWLACHTWGRESPMFASFNQAPKASSARLTGAPAIWTFTNFTLGPRDSKLLVQEPTMSDFLVHHGDGVIRELIEVNDSKIFQKRVDYRSEELLVQTNRYAVAPKIVRQRNSEFDQDSKQRETKVRRAYRKTGEIHAMLYAAEGDSTIDHFVMDRKLPRPKRGTPPGKIAAKRV